MSERAAYSRVYWTIVDDEKFVEIYDDDRHLACWLRLLLIADQAHPSSAHLPAGVRGVSVRALEAVGLIDVSGSRYRVRGLDAERERRRVAATSRGPNGTRTVPGRSPSGSYTQGLSLDEPRRDEPSRDAGASDDIVDDYYRLTGRFPNESVKGWLERLANEFGYDAASRKLGATFLEDPSPRTLLGRVENALKSDQHVATKQQAEAEKARLEAWNKDHRITPEQAAENQRRIAELQREWFGPKEAA